VNVKVEVRSENSWHRVLAIEVPAEDAAQEYEKVARKIATKVRLPGFRKGKVPLSVIRKSFKEDLDREFVESIVPVAFGRALEETKLDPITEPKFDELSFGETRPLSFTAEFDCRPELEIQGFKGIAIDKEIPEVPESAVDQVLEDFRKSHAELIEVEREAIPGDVLLLDYQAIDVEGRPIPQRAAKNFALEMGAGQVVEAFESALAKAQPGDVRIAEIPFPENHPDPLLAGKSSRYKVKVRKVQEKKLPSLDDALVQAHSQAKTADELRAQVRSELEARADRAGSTQLERMLLERVVDANPFDAPEALVESLLEETVHRMRHEATDRGEDPDLIDAMRVKESGRESARREVRRAIVLDLLARQEKIEVTADEIRERVDRLARLQGTNPRSLVRDLGGDRFLRGLTREIRDKKVLAFLVSNAEISSKTVRAAPQ
jgi:trigger factor